MGGCVVFGLAWGEIPQHDLEGVVRPYHDADDNQRYANLAPGLGNVTYSPVVDQNTDHEYYKSNWDPKWQFDEHFFSFQVLAPRRCGFGKTIGWSVQRERERESKSQVFVAGNLNNATMTLYGCHTGNRKRGDSAGSRKV